MAFDAVDIIAGNNYTYTALGELASDREEGIDTILWRPDGKIRKIIYEASTGKDNLEFQYDAMGNRIAKLIKDGSDSLIKATYYVRDAQGNVMTVYQWQINDTTTWPEHIAAERYIYGSSRLGVETTPVEMIGAMPQTQDTAVRFLQYKHYEISNHLGNVLAVVSDKKVLKDTNSDLVVDEYHPDMVSANDYSPFGVYLYGRTWSAGGYRYSFNGMERDDEISGSGNHYTTFYRPYDSRLGRWWATDPVVHPMYSPYSAFDNNPIYYVDPSGADSENETKDNLDKKTTQNEEQSNETKLSDLPKADNVGEFLSGAADKLNEGDRITGKEIKDFINPSDEKSGEKELGEILGQIDYLKVSKDGDKTTFTVNLKDGQKELSKDINTPDGNFNIKVKTGTQLVINKKSASEVTLDVQKLSVSKLGFINVGVPLGAIGVNINKDDLNISVLGITVAKQKVQLPSQFKK